MSVTSSSTGRNVVSTTTKQQTIVTQTGGGNVGAYFPEKQTVSKTAVGPKGDPGVHVGPTPPPDTSLVWVDTSS